MTCPSALTLSMHADAALPADQAAACERHASGCADCRQRLATLREERHAIRAALRRAEPAVTVPPFVPPVGPSVTRLLIWLGGIAGGAWVVNVAWLTIELPGLPRWADWLAPDVLGTGVDLAVRLLLRPDAWLSVLARLETVVGLIALCALGAAALWWLLQRGRGPSASLCLSLCLLAIGVLATPPAEAFDVRRDEHSITIPADETVDDTLILMAETILVEGTVTGDLVALGERVTVRGRVDGALVALAETVDLAGTVGGNLVGLAETLEVRESTLGANAYGMGRTVTVDARTRVAGNSALAAEQAVLQGGVERDLLTLARRVELSGTVAGGLRAYGETVSLGDGARVGGNLTARVARPDNLEIAAGATVVGDTALSTWPEQPNRYLTVEHYVGQVVKFMAAFLAGVVLFYLFPGLRAVQPQTGGELLTAAGVGAVVLVATPALAVAAVLTLIGAPLGLLALLGWLAGLYLAGIVTAALLGERLLGGAGQRPAVTLLAGLAVLFVLIDVPFLGGVVRLLAMLLGLGVIALWLRGRWAAR